MCRASFKVLTALMFLIFCFACSQSAKTYNAPEKKDLGENNYEYIDSPLYAASEAGAFDPELGSAEEAVAKFLSSRVRGDEAWKDALIPEVEWDDRLKSKLEDWAEWKILKWQLKRIVINGNRAGLTVYVELEYKGDTDDGEDEFELIKKNGVWRIFYPPT